MVQNLYLSSIKYKAMIAIAVLKMPRCMGDKIIRANKILNLLQNNTYLIAHWNPDAVSLADFETHVQNFIDAEVNTKLRTIGLVALRNTALALLMQDLKQLCSMVQGIANQMPEAAQAVIESAGFGVKTSGHRPKHINAAYNTQVAGIIKLTAEGMRAHEWQMSKDQINIISLPSTNNAQTYVKDLTPGDVWYFRMHKINTKKMTYNWSPWIKLFISAGGRVAKGISSTGVSGSIAA
jgi:hypothetical protein